MCVLSKLKQTFTLLGLMAISAMAEERPLIDILELSDGTILKGYISSKSNSKGITFESFDATIIIPQENVQSYKDNNVEVSSLNLYWGKWMEDNEQTPQDGQFQLSTFTLKKETDITEDAAVNTNNLKDSVWGYQLAFHQTKNFSKKKESATTRTQAKSTETVSTSRIEKKFYDTAKKEKFSILNQLPTILEDVHVLERGIHYKIIDVNSAHYSLPWSSIRKIQKVERPELQISGLLDEIIQTDGTSLKGFLISQEPNQSISIKNRETGEVNVIRMNNIAKQNRLPLSSEQTIIEQSPLLEIIKTKDNTRLEGVITSQIFKTKDPKDLKLLTMVSSTGRQETIDATTISEIKLKPNPDYHPLYDVLLDNEEDVIINGQHVKYARINIDNERVFTFDYKEPAVFSKNELADECILNVYTSGTQKEDNFELIYCTTMSDKKRNNESAKGFSFIGYQANSIHPEVSMTPKGCRVYRFRVPKTGLAMLYQSFLQKAIVIKIE